jgi:tRNA A-37 threonylcarbamoyl transferase component Bud32
MAGVDILGVVPDFGSGSMLLHEVYSDSAAERAGLRAGDRVLTVEGRPVRSGFDWMALSANFEPERALHLQVERDKERLDIHATLGRRSWRRAIRVDEGARLLLQGSQLFILVLAVIIVLRRPADRLALLGAWLLATVSILDVTLPYGFAATWRGLPLPLGALMWLPALSSSLAAPLLFTFSAVFPRPLFRARWAWLVALAPGVLIVPGVAYYLVRIVYLPERAPSISESFLLMLVVIPLYVVAGMIALVLNYRRLSDVNERRRVRVLVIGSVVGWLGVLPAPLMYWATRGSTLSQSPLYSILGFSSIVLFLAFPLAFGYALLRHRLFDIRLIVRQGLQYALARRFLLWLGPALGAVLVLDLLLHGDRPLLEVVKARGWIYAGLGAVTLAAQTRRERWLAALDRRFFRDRYNARRLLREVIDEARSARSLEAVATGVVGRIEAALHAEFVALVLRRDGQARFQALASSPAGRSPAPVSAESKLIGLVRVLAKPLEIGSSGSGALLGKLPPEEAHWLAAERIGLIVPVVFSREDVLVFLGEKRSEEPYSAEDQDLLAAIASSLALVVERGAPGSEVEELSTRVRSGAEALSECPRCGICYDGAATRCSSDEAELQRVLLPRFLVGRYHLERRLGRGGMGTVYAATDRALERAVAVKVIREDLLGSEEAAERFRGEARASAAFSHPNVLTVHDFGIVPPRRAFLVMEHLQGEPLREALRREGRLDFSRTVSLLRGVASAVDAAHRRGMVHRDLKPENIFLAQTEGEVIPKVLDFGLAKFVGERAPASTQTETGLLVGTLAYMAPERLLGATSHPGWDIWSLAVMAYEMLTGPGGSA